MKRVRIRAIGIIFSRPALIVLAVLAGAWAATPVRAKDVHGRVTGRVMDGTGAAMPAVNVTITSAEHQTTDSVVSDESGQYTKERLVPGTYEVTAEVAGFKVAVVRRLRVSAGRQTRVDFRMELDQLPDAVMAGAPHQSLLTERGDAAVQLRQPGRLPGLAAPAPAPAPDPAAATGTVLADIVPGGPTGNGRGIAFDGTNLWYTLLSDAHIYHVSTTGTALGSIVVGTGNEAKAGPLAWDGSSLWTADYSNPSSKLFQVSPTSGAILGGTCDFVAANPGNPAVPAPKGISFFPDGLDFGGGTFWMSGESSGNPSNFVAQLDTVCVILSSFVAPAVVTGADGVSGNAIVIDPFNGNKLWNAVEGDFSASHIFETDTSGTPTGLDFPAAHLTEDLAFDPVTFAPSCALWGNEATESGANHLTAYEVPCPEQGISATGTTISATEGASFTGTVASFTDPDPNATASEYAATINWGDGTAPTAGTITGPSGGPFTVTGTHTYTEEGTYTITVTITDVDTPSNSATATSTANVADAALAAGTLIVSGGVEGVTPTNVMFTFTDANPFSTVADFTATIAWGDGSSSSGIVSGPAGGPYTATGSHVYAEEGVYTLTVTVRDDGGSMTSKSGTATVADAPLAATCAAPPVSPMSFNGAVASFTDANPFGTVADFAATINWGDGASSAGIVSGPAGGPFTVSGSHVYVATGPVTITTTIVDDGGSMVMTGCSVLIFGTTPGGNFVIGDGNSAVGTAVTFWGAQWWKLNTLSGGPAPASFKGFADMPTTPPACGTNWSTDPGNSAPPPPGPLPAFMAVIVSSDISKSGSTISGNTPRVVVVRTNPGYAPNPGHEGTGTVVAVICP